MKTQAWTPPSAPEIAEKAGLFVDDLVQLTEIDTRVTGELPVVAAFVMALELISRKRPFEIRDTATFNLWLGFDGSKMEGPGSIQQMMHDTAIIFDAIVGRNLKDFADRAMESFRTQAAQRLPGPTEEDTAAAPEGPKASGGDEAAGNPSNSNVNSEPALTSEPSDERDFRQHSLQDASTRS